MGGGLVRGNVVCSMPRAAFVALRLGSPMMRANNVVLLCNNDSLDSLSL